VVHDTASTCDFKRTKTPPCNLNQQLPTLVVDSSIMAAIDRRRVTTSIGSKNKSMTTPHTSPASQKLSTNRKRKPDVNQPTKDEPTSPIMTKRRKVTNTPTSTSRGKAKVIDLTGDDGDDVEIVTPSKRKKPKAHSGQDEEKRLKMFRKSAPLTYLDKLHRAQTQR